MNMNDPETDATYVFNSSRHRPVDEQYFLIESTLTFLDSDEALLQFSLSDIAYLRGVWTRILRKVEQLESTLFN